VNGRLVRHFVDVGTGGEGSVNCDRDDYAADLLILIEGLQGVGEFAHQLEVEGIEFFGAIERDNTDTLVAVYENVLVV